MMSSISKVQCVELINVNMFLLKRLKRMLNVSFMLPYFFSVSQGGIYVLMSIT